MNYAKKLISTLLIAVMLFSTFNVAFGAAESSKSDIEGTWAEGQISAWIDKGFIKGYEDGSFKPDNTVTRAEFIAMINRSFGLTETTAVSFSDLTPTNWAYAEVSKAVKAGYIKGYVDGTIGVSNPISRQEAAVIVDRLLGLSNIRASAANFTDSSSIASWAKASVDAAVAKGILKGYAKDNSFNPSKPITRAEAVVTLDRAVNAKATVYSSSGTYGPEKGTETIDGDVVISVTGVTLQNMIINGNLLFAADIEEGDAHLKNVTVKGVTRVEGGGVNSIYLKNTIVFTLIVDKKKGPVRIVVEGSTTVGEATIHSPATLQESDTTGSGFSKITLSELLPAGSTVTLRGTFDSLTVKGKEIKVDIPKGSIKEFITAATTTGMTLSLGTDASIVSLILDAVAKILGTGTIEKLTLGSDAKDSTTIEITIRLLGKVKDTVTPSGPSTGGTNTTPPSNGGTDTTAPILSHVTIGQISVGDHVLGTSNEGGYLYLVPSATVKTIADLNKSVADSLGSKLSVTANVESTISTAGLALGTYVVYAVDSSNNISIASADIVIGTKQLTISNPDLTEVKMYDGTTSASVTASSLIGVVAGDIVTVSAVATYNDTTIGTGKIITVVYTLGGANAANYIAPVSYTVNTGVITAAQLTIGDPVLTVEKPNENDDSYVVVTAAPLDGIVGNEDVTVSAEAVYDTSASATDLTVVYTIAGANKANYIAPVSFTNYIIKKSTSADTGKNILDLITKSKVYDGTTTVAIIVGPRDGIIDGDELIIGASAFYDDDYDDEDFDITRDYNGDGFVGDAIDYYYYDDHIYYDANDNNDADKNVGTNKQIKVRFILSGSDAGNYFLPHYKVTTGAITAKQLTIAAPALTVSKVYDGATTAVVTPGALTNVISGDDVTVHAVATYNNASVGTNKLITIVYTLSGADAGNYVAPANDTVSTGVITVAP